MNGARSRAEYLREVFPEDLGEIVAGTVRKEDELMWAFHRAPDEELTQREARDRALIYEYPREVRPSQPTVSRRLDRLDRALLVGPVTYFQGHDAEAGLLDPEEYERLGENGFSNVLERYQATLASTLVDLEALNRFRNGTEPTPEWARRRFPDLDPDLGRRLWRRADLGNPTTDLHPPTEGITADD